MKKVEYYIALSKGQFIDDIRYEKIKGYVFGYKSLYFGISNYNIINGLKNGIKKGSTWHITELRTGIHCATVDKRMDAVNMIKYIESYKKYLFNKMLLPELYGYPTTDKNNELINWMQENIKE